MLEAARRRWLAMEETCFGKMRKLEMARSNSDTNNKSRIAEESAHMQCYLD